MKTQTIWRTKMALGVLVLGLTACAPPAIVKSDSALAVQAAMQSAKEAYQRQDYAQAVQWFHKAAEQGDAKAQFNLGIAYDEGKGVAQDYTQAAQWFRKAAEQGIPQAQNNLGILYQQGQGVSKDLTQAVEWFGKAAAQGNPQAQKNLGLAYRDGLGIQKDSAQAAQWLGKAAAQGDTEAQSALNQLKGVSRGAHKTIKTGSSAKPKTPDSGKR